jgi:hypothetical protein
MCGIAHSRVPAAVRYPGQLKAMGRASGNRARPLQASLKLLLLALAPDVAYGATHKAHEAKGHHGDGGQ